VISIECLPMPPLNAIGHVEAVMPGGARLMLDSEQII
jgi:hypothetical protein